MQPPRALFFVLSLSLHLLVQGGMADPTKSGNPVIPGWYADPEVRVFDREYFIYPTTSTVFEKQTYFEAFSSRNLVTWVDRGRILDLKNVSWSTDQAAWAPSVGFKDGTYYLYFAAGNGAGIGVAKSPSPAGPFEDALGKPLISGKHGAHPIDPMIFMDDDGRNYLYYGGLRHSIVVELNDDMVSVKADFTDITPKGYVEGPWMMKREGIYYFLYSVGEWQDNSYGVSYVTGIRPLGPFKGEPKKILSGNGKIGTGTGHNSVFNIRNEYYIAYHRRYPRDQSRDHRVICIDRMYFSNQDEIKPVRITKDGVNARPL